MVENAVRVLSEIQETTFEWKIENFLNQHRFNNEHAQSSIFLFANERWYLGIYPTDEMPFCNMSLYLFKMTSPAESRITYTIGVIKPDGSVFKSFSEERVFKKVEWGGYGDRDFLDSKFKKSDHVYGPDDTLTVFCTLTTGEKAINVPKPTEEATSQTLSSESFANLLENFKDLMQSGHHGDIKFLVKDRMFLAHRCILAIRSPDLAAQFFEHAAENEVIDVKISDCDPDTFEDFLLFLYTGDVNHGSHTNAIDLYKQANKYQMHDLKRSCCLCLENNLEVDSVLDVIQLAVSNGESELLKTAKLFFEKHSDLIRKTPKWKILLQNNPFLADDLHDIEINKLKEDKCVLF